MEILLASLETFPSSIMRAATLATKKLEAWALLQEGGPELDLKIKTTFRDDPQRQEDGHKTVVLVFNDLFDTEVSFDIRKISTLDTLVGISAKVGGICPKTNRNIFCSFPGSGLPVAELGSSLEAERASNPHPGCENGLPRPLEETLHLSRHPQGEEVGEDVPDGEAEGAEGLPLLQEVRLQELVEAHIAEQELQGEE